MGSERIATVWLDVPGKRVNTLSRAMWRDLATAIDEVERASPAALVVTSAKHKSFVVGADLFELRDMSDGELNEYIRTGQMILNRIQDLPIPTIAAINGDCLGGGLELALSCRQRICVDDPAILIGLPETRLGLVPAWGGTLRLTNLVGVRRALSLMIGGHMIDPFIADSFSIVDELVSADQLLTRAKTRVLKRAEGRQLSHEEIDFDSLRQGMVQAPTLHTFSQLRLLEVVNTGMTHGTVAGMDAERDAIVELRRSLEAQELMKAFFDKRRA